MSLYISALRSLVSAIEQSANANGVSQSALATAKAALEPSMAISEDDAHRAAYVMEKGQYGSFASHIGAAYMLADSYNRQVVLDSFRELFQTVVSYIEERA